MRGGTLWGGEMECSRPEFREFLACGLFIELDEWASLYELGEIWRSLAGVTGSMV